MIKQNKKNNSKLIPSTASIKIVKRRLTVLVNKYQIRLMQCVIFSAINIAISHYEIAFQMLKYGCRYTHR